MTRSKNTELNGSLMKADQLHSTVELAQTRSCDVESPQNAGFQVVRMQRIEKKQVADDRVLAESCLLYTSRCV